MPLIGNQLGSAENNSFRVLDNISNFTLTFDGSSSSVVSSSSDSLLLYQHPFVTGQRVTYSSGGGTQIGGLTSGSVYYINKIDQNSFRLSTTYAGSLQNTNIVDIVAPGTGISHTFNVAFDGINTKFKATYNNGTKCNISRAAQLDIAVNGVLQQPYDSNPPPNGFTIEADSTIVFSTAPLAGYSFWGKVLSGSVASFETSDNTIDTFTGNGSQVSFTLSKNPVNNQNVLVTINGVTQYPTDSSTARSYSVNANIITFTAAPANGAVIQVRHIGFAGATSSSVTGFYGRTGNVTVTTSDTITPGNVYVGTATSTGTASQPLQVTGGAYFNGNLGIGVTNPLLQFDAGGSTTASNGGVTNATFYSGFTPSGGGNSFGGILLGAGINGNTPFIAASRNGAGTGLPLTFFTNGSERVRINADGVLLVGTATSTGTASQPLQVTGGAYVSGSLGIGTTNPITPLHVVGSGTTTLLVQGNARITGILTVGTGSITFNGSANTISGISSITDSSGGYLSIPPGAVQFFASSTAPNGWIKANGATISRSAYAALFAALGTTFGAGDGSTTFVIPDMRGEFPRGWDDGRGIDSGRSFGSAQTDQLQNITGSISTILIKDDLAISSSGALSGSKANTGGYGAGGNIGSGTISFNASSSSGARTGTETRARNIALLACIKY